MGNLVFQATLGGQVNLVGPNTASTFNLNVPAVSSTIATTSGTETLTNKTLTTPVINGFTGDTSVVNIGSGQFYKDTSGNIGVGVTPSTWTVFKAQEIGVSGSAMAAYSGGLNFVRNGYYNSGWKYAGTGISTLYEQSASGHAWFYSASGTAGNAITFTQAMTLDASGNFLVGTTTAREQLTVNSAGYFAGDFNNANAANGLYVSGNSSGVSQIRGYNTSGGVLAFFTNPAAGSGAERARIDSSGNLLVSSTSSTPANDANAGFCAGSTAGVGSSWVKIPNNAVNGYAAFVIYRGSSAIGSISYNGTGVNYNNTSDERLKENIVDAESALVVLQRIQIRSFDWKNNSVHTPFGVIAQELFDVVPEAVTKGTDNEDGTVKTYWGVDYGKIVPHLVKAIQEQQAIIESLTARITALEA